MESDVNIALGMTNGLSEVLPLGPRWWSLRKKNQVIVQECFMRLREMHADFHKPILCIKRGLVDERFFDAAIVEFLGKGGVSLNVVKCLQTTFETHDLLFVTVPHLDHFQANATSHELDVFDALDFVQIPKESSNSLLCGILNVRWTEGGKFTPEVFWQILVQSVPRFVVQIIFVLQLTDFDF